MSRLIKVIVTDEINNQTGGKLQLGESTIEGKGENAINAGDKEIPYSLLEDDDKNDNCKLLITKDSFALLNNKIKNAIESIVAKEHNLKVQKIADMNVKLDKEKAVLEKTKKTEISNIEVKYKKFMANQLQNANKIMDHAVTEAKKKVFKQYTDLNDYKTLEELLDDYKNELYTENGQPETIKAKVNKEEAKGIGDKLGQTFFGKTKIINQDLKVTESKIIEDRDRFNSEKQIDLSKVEEKYNKLTEEKIEKHNEGIEEINSKFDKIIQNKIARTTINFVTKNAGIPAAFQKEKNGIIESRKAEVMSLIYTKSNTNLNFRYKHIDGTRLKWINIERSAISDVCITDKNYEELFQDPPENRDVSDYSDNPEQIIDV